MTFLLAGGGGILSFNPGFALWILISMIIFILVMMKYAVPPIMKSLNEREAKIKDSLESAEKALERAEAISKDNEKPYAKLKLKHSKLEKRRSKKQSCYVQNASIKLRMKLLKLLSKQKTRLIRKRNLLLRN